MPFPIRSSLLAPLLLALAQPAAAEPAYTADGELIAPTDYREWVYLTSGLDMSYSILPSMMGHSMFDNVFVDPASWAEFKKTGHWPDKAMFALESRRAESKGSINKRGQYQTDDVMGVEFHVRDEARFKGGWAFFRVDGTAPAKQVPYDADCYACHLAHGAVDTTFTQFYPTAKPIAVKAGTYQEK